MTTFEQCKVARQHADVLKTGDSYGQNSTVDFDSIDINDLTDEECTLLGFGKWEIRDAFLERKTVNLPSNNIRLIPYWIYPWISQRITAYSILADVITTKDEMDNDTRGGYLAYGIIPKDK